MIGFQIGREDVMIEHATQVAREFHTGPNGKRFLLARDLKTGRPYVLHRPQEDEPEIELDLGSSLVLFQGHERENLLRLIASLLPDEGASAFDDANIVWPPRSVSRWRPRRRNGAEAFIPPASDGDDRHYRR